MPKNSVSLKHCFVFSNDVVFNDIVVVVIVVFGVFVRRYKSCKNQEKVTMVFLILGYTAALNERLQAQPKSPSIIINCDLVLSEA